jgi:hypothetical protein
VLADAGRRRLAGWPSLLEALQAGVAGQLAVLDDAGITGTGLSSSLAHRFAGRFAGPALRAGLRPISCEVDLHGFDGLRAQASSENSLARLLTETGFQGKLASSTDGLAAQWRGHLAKAFLVLLLDNAADAEQVLPFLPGESGHVVLVTSRRSLQALRFARGVRSVDLPVLSPRDAAQLITAVVGRPLADGDEKAIEGIAEFCSCHALAIMITASGLAEMPHTSLAHGLEQLRAAPDRLLAVDEYVNEESGRVAKAFEFSYLQLSAECQLVLRRLGVAPVASISVETGCCTGTPRSATGSSATSSTPPWAASCRPRPRPPRLPDDLAAAVLRHRRHGRG